MKKVAGFKTFTRSRPLCGFEAAINDRVYGTVVSACRVCVAPFMEYALCLGSIEKFPKTYTVQQVGEYAFVAGWEPLEISRIPSNLVQPIKDASEEILEHFKPLRVSRQFKMGADCEWLPPTNFIQDPKSYKTITVNAGTGVNCVVYGSLQIPSEVGPVTSGHEWLRFDRTIVSEQRHFRYMLNTPSIAITASISPNTASTSTLPVLIARTCGDITKPEYARGEFYSSPVIQLVDTELLYVTWDLNIKGLEGSAGSCFNTYNIERPSYTAIPSS